jgi:hypothetical protein
MTRPALFTLCAAALLLSSAPAAAREARIKLPDGLTARTERLDVTGMGGGRSGRLALGASAGEFTRQADRIGVVDPLFTKNYGGGAFRIRGPEVGGELGASCRFRRLQSTVGPISVSTKRLTYTCSFERDGKPLAARIELRDRDGALGSADGRDAREGVIVFEGVELRMRSLHKLAGSPLAVPHALGYVFEANGVPVGAVDLNGNTRRIHAPADPAQRQAVIAAALALSIFWDPAVVDPGD